MQIKNEGSRFHQIVIQILRPFVILKTPFYYLKCRYLR